MPGYLLWQRARDRSVGNNELGSCVNVVMGRPRLLLIVVVLVLAELLRGPTAVLASCAVTPQLATALADAPAVFVGTVTAVDHAGRVATVDVQDVWKGRVTAEVQVIGTADLNAAATSVDRYYAVGQKYLFIPNAGGGTSFQDNNCTLTQAYAAGLATFRPSGAPGPPSAPRGAEALAPPPASTTSPWPLFVVAGGLILLIVVMLFGIAQRRRHATTSAGR